MERVHLTYEREMYRVVRTDDDEHFRTDARGWRQLYNRERPHEALDDEPPITRWRPSPRPRPAELPEVTYDAGATLRTIGRHGDVSRQGKRIVVGEGPAGQQVRVEEGEAALSVSYARWQVRTIPPDTLARAGSRQVV